MQDIKAFISRYDQYAQSSDIELCQVSEGAATAVMTVQSKHLNGLKMAHGGAIFTLADLAFAAAANSRGIPAVGINASITYISSASHGDKLTATATEIFSRRTLCGYQVEVHREDGELVAVFQGTAYKREDSRF